MNPSTARPSLVLPLLLSIVCVAFMAWLRLYIYPTQIVPLAYPLPLLLGLWHRRPWLLWGMAGCFLITVLLKFALFIPRSSEPLRQDLLFAGMQMLNILVATGVVHAVIIYRARLEQSNAALEQSNAELLASNEELAAREEEIAQQNEELQSQAEELEQQAEEVRAQSHELQLSNEELAGRERILEALLLVAGPAADERDISRVACEFSLRVLSASSAAVLVPEPEVLRVIAHEGFAAPPPATVARGESFAQLICAHRTVGTIDDIAQRPDLTLLTRDNAHASVIAVPWLSDGEVLAVLEVYAAQPRRWNAEDARLLQWLAVHCARIWDNIRLRRQLQDLAASLDQRVTQRTAQLAAIASELTLTEQRERRRLAAELHDNLAQMLAVSKMRLARLDGAGGEPVEQVRVLLDQAIAFTRSLMSDLTPPMLYDFGIVAALGRLAETFGKQHGITVTVDAADEPPLSEDFRIILFQGVRELLFNILKHAQVSEACIRVRTLGEQAVIIVEDRGRGFDPAAVRADNGSVSGGFGLLSIRDRLNLLGGSMHIESRAGDGSVITLTAPLHRPASTHDPATPARFDPADLSDGSGLRILLVDDHAMFRQGLAHALGGNPRICIVGEADNGRAAVDLAAALQPDVVVMDVNMPQMNGIDATRAIKRARPATRVIAVTINLNEEVRHALLTAGADACLPKDGELAQLTDQILAAQIAR